MSTIKELKKEIELLENEIKIKSNKLNEYKDLLKVVENHKDINFEFSFDKNLPLSKREFDVYEQVLTGKNNKEIAKQLYISVNTVKKHINNILGKLCLKSRNEIIVNGLKD